MVLVVREAVRRHHSDILCHQRGPGTECPFSACNFICGAALALEASFVAASVSGNVGGFETRLFEMISTNVPQTTSSPFLFSFLEIRSQLKNVLFGANWVLGIRVPPFLGGR